MPTNERNTMNDKPLNIKALDEADPMWRERKLGIKVIESDDTRPTCECGRPITV